MNIIAFHGSPRRNSNSSHLLREFLRGAEDSQAQIFEVAADRINLTSCRGCLKCNLIKRCAIKGDEWDTLRPKILSAGALVFASPVYFHHLSSPMKKILDRFRSFMHVQITGRGLNHTTWQKWKKHFVLLLALGSPDDADAKPLIELFTFLTHVLGPGNSLHTIVATRLAVKGQITMSRDELSRLYNRMKLPDKLADIDCERNRVLLQSCYDLGRSLAHQEGA